MQLYTAVRCAEKMNAIYEDSYLLIKGIKNEGSSVCVISFTGVGHLMGGVDVQREEFVGSALKNGSVFFVTDKTRSWSNNIDEKRLKSQFIEFGSFDKIVSIGNSMGGTNALLLGGFLGSHTIIAFTPQFSVHPGIFPRLSNKQITLWRDAINKWKYKSVEDSIAVGTREYIFHGDSLEELLQAVKFRKQKNRVHFIIKNCGHDVAMKLKEKGALSTIVDKCIMNANFKEVQTCLMLFGIEVVSDKRLKKIILTRRIRYWLGGIKRIPKLILYKIAK